MHSIFSVLSIDSITMLCQYTIYYIYIYIYIIYIFSTFDTVIHSKFDIDSIFNAMFNVPKNLSRQPDVLLKVQAYCLVPIGTNNMTVVFEKTLKNPSRLKEGE